MSSEAQRVTGLVLLPGMDGTGRLFRPLVQQLKPDLVPTVVSYPAQAASDADALVSIVERVLPAGEPFAVVAESFSGPLALKVAAKAPAGLRALVLVATFVRSPAGAVLSHLGALAPLLTSVPMPRFAIRRFLAGEDAPGELVSEVAETIRSVRPGCIAARIRQVLSLDVSAEAARCPVPVLYLAGKWDRLVSPRSEVELRALLPHMSTRVLDAPHLVLQRRPAEAAEAIAEFLAGVP